MAAIRQDGADQGSMVKIAVGISTSMTPAVAIMTSAALPTAGQSTRTSIMPRSRGAGVFRPLPGFVPWHVAPRNRPAPHRAHIGGSLPDKDGDPLPGAPPEH